ncbi:DUF63 family protein [Haloarcula montana]|uniref:DUF63 family protein n=1 Tax=Haloarcula montana TaxID=3111776 RepID=UPI002D788903|nr:DUF63 family protein [Haloarcula sp. GH36]
MVLPSGFGLPPLPYVIALASGTLLVTVLLYAVEPPIDQRTVAALAPWMAVGGALHAFNQPPIEAYDAVYRPLFGTPSVYLTIYVVLGTAWIAASLLGVRRGHDETVTRNLGLIGTGVLTVLLVIGVTMALEAGSLFLLWPTVAVVASVVVAAVVVLIVALWRTPVVVRARYAAPVVVFAHTLDGISTAIGTDILGIGERSPVPRAIMEFAGSLEASSVLGSGWLFVAVKLIVAVAVVLLMHQYLEEEPVEGGLLLSLIAAVGLGPATNNIVLFLFLAP